MHRSLTLNQWYKNFKHTSGKLPADAYSSRTIKLWALYLAWSTLAAKRGSIVTYHILAHKGVVKRDQFNRAKVCGVGCQSSASGF